MTDIKDPSKPLCTTPELSALIYGPPGIGKSTLGSHAAKWLYDERGLRTRLILTDGGSYAPYRRGIEAGYIDLMSADGWDKYSPSVLFKLLAEGSWPEDQDTPNSPLRPGFSELRICPGCGESSGSYGAAQVPKCEKCGKEFPAGVRLPIARQLTSLAGIGLVIIESLTKIGDMLLDAHRVSKPGEKYWHAGSGEYQELCQKANEAARREPPTPQDLEIIKAAKAAQEAGFISLAMGSDQAHYLFADKELQAIISAAKKIPVPYLLWTAHQGAWEEKVNPKDRQSPSKLRGLGPIIPVMKRNQVLPGWFSLVGRVVKTNNGRELVMEEHFGPESNTVPWTGKVNEVGLKPRLPLEDPLKRNNWASLMEAIKVARERNLP